MHRLSLSKFVFVIVSSVYLTSTSGIQAQESPVPKALEDIPTEETEQNQDWAISLGAGLTMKSGNTESDSYNARLEANKTCGKTIIRFLADGNYSESETEYEDGKKETSRTDGNAKINLNIKQRFNGCYVFADGVAFHDGPADIRFRGIVSTGVGAFLADSETFKFSVDVGVAYVDEQTKIEDDNYWALRFGNRIDYTYSDTVKFWQTTEYLPEANDFGNHLISAEFGLGSKLTDIASLNLIFKVDYDAKPPQGTDSTDRMFGALLAFSL